MTKQHPVNLESNGGGDIYDAASKHHKDASAPRMKKDENDVKKAMHTIEIWVNPFKSSSIVSPQSQSIDWASLR